MRGIPACTLRQQKRAPIHRGSLIRRQWSSLTNSIALALTAPRPSAGGRAWALLPSRQTAHVLHLPGTRNVCNHLPKDAPHSRQICRPALSRWGTGQTRRKLRRVLMCSCLMRLLSIATTKHTLSHQQIVYWPLDDEDLRRTLHLFVAAHRLRPDAWGRKHRERRAPCAPSGRSHAQDCPAPPGPPAGLGTTPIYGKQSGPGRPPVRSTSHGRPGYRFSRPLANPRWNPRTVSVSSHRLEA